MDALAQAWPFVHPAMAAAAVALGALPIIIHLINRRRFTRVPWAAMTFLLAANRRSARRMWIEHWLLLLARIALIVLFGLAVARPFFPASGRLPIRASGVHRIVLLDNSLSMNASAGAGGTRFAAAKSAAERLLESFPPDDGVSLLTLAAPAQTIVGQATHDRRVARERLAAIEPTQRAADLAGAISATIDLLEESRFPQVNRAVYVISDLPRRTWAGEPGGQPSGAMSALRRLAEAVPRSGTDLNVVLVAPSPHDNVAVTALTPDSALTAPNQPVRLTARITNFGGATVRDRTLQIRRDGQIVRREPLPAIAPGASVSTRLTAEFAAAGTHMIDTRVAGPQADALIEDDARYLSLEIREAAPFLLVDGRPGASKLSGEAGYLATALAPKFAETQPVLVEPRVISEPELAAEALSDYAVIVLCGVQRLSESMWNQLAAYVSAGGGLMVFAGDRISLENYNRFGFADGRGVLPGRLGRIVDIGGEDAQRLGFKLPERGHPITADFVNHPESSLFSARATKYLPLDVPPERGQTALRFTNDQAALVTATFGAGRVLWCGVGAGMEWSSLPAKGDYVSLMLNAAAFLTPQAGAHRNIVVGDPVRERLSPAQASMPLRVAFDGKVEEPSITPRDDSLILTSTPAEAAGFAAVSIGPTVRSFAVNVDTAESDLHPIERAAFEEALGRPVRFVGDPTAITEEPAAARSTELAGPALYLVLLLLLIEAGLAAHFGSLRGSDGKGEASDVGRSGGRQRAGEIRVSVVDGIGRPSAKRQARPLAETAAGDEGRS